MGGKAYELIDLFLMLSGCWDMTASKRQFYYTDYITLFLSSCNDVGR